MDSILILVVFSSGFIEKSKRVATFFKSVHFCVLICCHNGCIRRKRLSLHLQYNAGFQNSSHAEHEHILVRALQNRL